MKEDVYINKFVHSIIPLKIGHVFFLTRRKKSDLRKIYYRQKKKKKRNSAVTDGI